MTNRWKLTAACAAVSAAFAMPAQAQIHGAGASAIKNSLLSALITDDCDPASGIFVFDNKTAATNPGTAAGTVFELQCTPVASGRFSTSPIVVSYDTTGGSWKAFTSTTPAIYSAAQNNPGAGSTTFNPVKTIQQGGCFNTAFNSFKRADGTFVTVSYSWGCTATPLTLGTDTVTFGLTDVETKMFAAIENQPLQDATWNSSPLALVTVGFAPATELTGFPKPVFGVVFGIAASQPLWLAMQTDQINAGLLTGCTSGTTSVISSSESCTPFISKEQYASIVALTGGASLTDTKPLFHSTSTTLSDYEYVLARRDRGSGTQSGSNAYFVNIGCSNTLTEGPDATVLPLNTVSWGGTFGSTVTYGPSTDDIIAELQVQGTTPNGVTDCTSGSPTCGTMTYPSSSFVIGVVSGEKFSATSITASGAIGTSTAPWGFLRLDGFLPQEDAVQDGKYQYTTTENLHCNINATGDGKQLCQDLGGITAGATSLLTYANTGVYPLTGATKSGHAVNYTNKNKVCSGTRHL